MKFINYAVVHFSILLVLGITAAHFFPCPFLFSFKILLALVALLLITWIIARTQLSPTIFFEIIAYLCFFGIGYFNYQIRLPNFQPEHYSRFSSEEIPMLLQIKIIEVLKPDNYNHNYIVKALALNGKKTTGKILIALQKDSLLKNKTIDDVLLVSATLKTIPEPLNPNQFDYSKYIQSLGVYHQIHVSKDHILKNTVGIPTLRGRAEHLRTYLLEKLQRTHLNTNERAIIQALVLGQKKDINKALYNDYAAAGAVHILAVSGLHMGIVFLIFSTLFYPLNRLKYGMYAHSILLLLCLWSFAFITGLSPSVTRAATMFSFFAFAKSINRQTNTINTLFLSFFILLLFNPLWLFHVGFQLSYLAVISILIVQPKLHKYYRPRFYLDKLFWGIFTVSIAAQLGIIPLSLYYFHQFPGLFLITNIVVLPVLGILLGGGVLIVVLAVFGWLPEWLVFTYNFLIGSLNGFISWIANQEHFLFENIHFSEVKVISSYLFLAAMMLVWKKFNYIKLVFVLVSFSLLTSIFIWNKFETSGNQLVVFHKSKKTLIGYKQAGNLIVLRRDSVKSSKNTFPIKGYFIAQNITNYSEEDIPEVFRYRNNIILVLDSLGVYPKLSEKAIVILTESPKVNLERLIDSLQPQLIIADGSNYISYIARWKKTCLQKKLPFHPTGVKGALIIE